MTWREIEARNLKSLRKPIIIDVRSPCEFAVERIPDAINIPLLTDIEREEVGTIYARQGEVVARRVGLKFISPKIPEIVDQILALRQKDSSLIVHCWRGGLRSEAVASFLTIVGIDCWRLKGGYKAWRNFVLSDFAVDAYPFQAVVLHGRTGTGKTEVLTELEKLGAQTLDLEGLAKHKGSLFGALEGGKQPTQKNFEGDLWERLHGSGPTPLFIEAESRTIGRLTMPDFIMRRIQSGERVLIYGSTAIRVNRLLQSYMPDNNSFVVLEARKVLSSLVERLGKQVISELDMLAEKGDFAQVVQSLLELYYDPHYDKHIVKNFPFALEVNSDDATLAAAQILEWSNRTFQVS